MVSRYRQRGMSVWGLLGLVVLLGFVAVLLLMLFPMYMTYWSITSAAESVREDTSPDDSVGKIWERCNAQFNLNNVREFDPRDVMKIQRADGGFRFEIAYEQRKHVFYNVSVVTSFETTIGP